jgi:hypothetical protein
VAFGDLDAGIWGFCSGATEPRLALGTVPATIALPGAAASIGGSGPHEDWKLTASGIELMVSPETEAAELSQIEGYDQLCRVRGRALLDGGEREIDLPGRRGSRPEIDFGKFESVRDLGAWFAHGDGLALSSFRPRGAKGHDRDVVAASLFEPAGLRTVADPRISTTYAADGHPVKVGLELWIDLDDSDEQYPRRAAGEMLGASTAWAQPLADLEAYLVRCWSRGEEGVGVYAIARSR